MTEEIKAIAQVDGTEGRRGKVTAPEMLANVSIHPRKSNVRAGFLLSHLLDFAPKRGAILPSPAGFRDSLGPFAASALIRGFPVKFARAARA